ncbi:MAG TPA: single-stranded DNA-binding protein [Candidatus Limnocylindria bacterium]
MTNTWIGLGRLASDPQLRHADSGTPVNTMRVAVPRHGDDDRADFVSVVCFNRLAEACAAHLSTGRQVLIEGSIRQQTWTDKDTQERRGRIEIVARRVQFLGAPRQEADEPSEDQVAA